MTASGRMWTMKADRTRTEYAVTHARAGLAFACALMAATSLADAAETLRMCVDDRPHPPFLYADRDGSVQTLVRMAAAQAGIPIEILPMPVRRCKAAVQRHAIDAMLMTAFVTTNASFMAFPIRDGRPDQDKAVATAYAKVFRRKGSSASWDGVRFSNVQRPVLVPTGYAFISDQLAQAQVPFDEGARHADQNFMKLLGSRADLVILPENDGMELLRDPKWAARIEDLPVPFNAQDFYLAFSTRYFQRQPDMAAAFWRAIADVRASREYRQAITPQR